MDYSRIIAYEQAYPNWFPSISS